MGPENRFRITRYRLFITPYDIWVRVSLRYDNILTRPTFVTEERSITRINIRIYVVFIFKCVSPTLIGDYGRFFYTRFVFMQKHALTFRLECRKLGYSNAPLMMTIVNRFVSLILVLFLWLFGARGFGHSNKKCIFSDVTKNNINIFIILYIK